MLKITPAQAYGLKSVLAIMFENGDAKTLWSPNEIKTAKVFLNGLNSGMKTFGIITDEFSVVVQDCIAAADRIPTMSRGVREGLILAANQAGIAVCS